MEWTQDQEKALEIMYQNYMSNERFTFISGVAGSGKSTILLEIISRLQLPDDSVRCLSYTGKASQVLQSKGLPNVSTIHSFLYYPIDDYGTIEWCKKSLNTFKDIKLIIIDEISMVPSDIWRDLLSLKIHIIGTGDLEQLPPVNNSKINWNKLYGKRKSVNIGGSLCDYHMTQITRQSKDSDIIDKSLLIRDRGAQELLNLKNYQSSEISILKPDQVTPELILSQDIVLCATNQKRSVLNYLIRSLRYSKLNSDDLIYPQSDDILICLTNKWDIVNLNHQPIINGLRGKLDSFKLTRRRTQGNVIYKMKANFYANEDQNTLIHDPFNLYADLNLNYQDLLNQPLSKTEYLSLDSPISVDYGYAISVHKAQGSEFDNIMIFEENWPSEFKFKKQFWYTAITRARKHVTIVRPY